MTTAENQSSIPELDGRAGVRASGSYGFSWKTMNTNLWMISVVTLALAASASASWSGQHITLLQEPDAAKLRHTKQEWPNVPHTLNSSAGPIIDVEKPKVVDEANGPTIEAATPVNIDVLFQPRCRPPGDNRPNRTAAGQCERQIASCGGPVSYSCRGNSFSGGSI